MESVFEFDSLCCGVVVGLVCCDVALKPFLVDFDPAKADAMFAVLAGPDFGASTADDLLMMTEKEWERLADRQELGQLTARRLRDRLTQLSVVSTRDLLIQADAPESQLKSMCDKLEV